MFNWGEAGSEVSWDANFRDIISVPKRRYVITTIHCVISQNDADIICFTAEN
jgi:hypothetical protein